MTMNFSLSAFLSLYIQLMHFPKMINFEWVSCFTKVSNKGLKTDGSCIGNTKYFTRYSIHFAEQ